MAYSESRMREERLRAMRLREEQNSAEQRAVRQARASASGRAIQDFAKLNGTGDIQARRMGRIGALETLGRANDAMYRQSDKRVFTNANKASNSRTAIQRQIENVTGVWRQRTMPSSLRGQQMADAVRTFIRGGLLNPQPVASTTTNS